jgi:hypothetical protein
MLECALRRCVHADEPELVVEDEVRVVHRFEDACRALALRFRLCGSFLELDEHGVQLRRLRFQLGGLVLEHVVRLLALGEEPLHLAPCAYMVGDVGAVAHDAPSLAVCVAQGLVDEVDEAFFGLGASAANEPEGNLASRNGDACIANLVEERLEALPARIRDGLPHGPADDVPPPDEGVIRFVGILEYVFGTGDHADEGRDALEGLEQARAFPSEGVARANLFRDFDGNVVDGDDVARVVRQCTQRIREPGVLGLAALEPLHREQGLVGEDRVAAVADLRELRLEGGPELVPHRGAGTAQCLRFLGAEDSGVGVVVDEGVGRTAPETHRDRRREHQSHSRA